jgi:hypothetical protein
MEGGLSRRVRLASSRGLCPVAPCLTTPLPQLTPALGKRCFFLSCSRRRKGSLSSPWHTLKAPSSAAAAPGPRALFSICSVRHLCHPRCKASRIGPVHISMNLDSDATDVRTRTVAVSVPARQPARGALSCDSFHSGVAAPHTWSWLCRSLLPVSRVWPRG